MAQSLQNIISSLGITAGPSSKAPTQSYVNPATRVANVISNSGIKAGPSSKAPTQSYVPSSNANLQNIISNSGIIGGGYSSYGGSSSYGDSYYVPPAATNISAGTKVNTPVATTMDAGAISNAGAGTTSVNIGTAPASAYNPSVATAGNIATGLNPDGSQKITATTGETTAKTTTTPVDTAQEAFNKYIANIEKPADLAVAYNQAEQQAGLIKAQTEKNNISNALNAETTRMNLDLQNLRGVGAREGVTEAVYGQQSAEVTRESMTRILPLQAQLAMANDNVQLAQQQTDTLFKIYAQDAQNKVDYRNKLVKENYDFFTAQEKKQLDKQAKIDDFNMKLYGDKIASINDAANQALSKGNTALYRALTSTPPPQYNGQSDFGAKVDAWSRSISSNAAKYGGTSTVGTPQGLSDEVNKIFAKQNANTPAVAKTVLASLVGNKSVSSGTRAKISPALEVLNAADELANTNLEGEFKGTGGIFGLAPVWEGIKGLVNMQSKEYQNNVQALEAINLKTQQWASGAALTDAQTEQVKKLTPSAGDSDKTIRNKTNGLYNFMLNQAEGNLLAEGINVQFPPVNLFEISDLYEKASPEQRKVIEQTYFNK